MPRDGSGIYTTPPGTTAVPDTTIESAKYNANVADVAADLNAARPIVAGGTSGTSATAARANLKAEVAGAQVANYDTHAFENGSFWSSPGATGAPNAVQFFIGTCTMIDSGALSLHAQDMATFIVYNRIKVGGAGQPWSAWVPTGASSFVELAGDTMSGNLAISKTTPQFSLHRTAGDGGAYLTATVAGVARWTMQMGDGAAEAGANAGSNFVITSYSDAGGGLANALQINRASGNVIFANNFQIGGADIPASGIIATSTVVALRAPTPTGTVYIQNGNAGGSTINYGIFNTTGLIVTGAVVANFGAGFTPTNPIGAGLRTGGSYGGGLTLIDGATYCSMWAQAGGLCLNVGSGSDVGTDAFNIDGSRKVTLSKGFWGRQGYGGAVGGGVNNFYWTGALQAWIDLTNVGTIAFTSDYRTKKDVADLPSTWETVRGLRPISYTQAEYTPQIEKERMVKEAAAEAARRAAEPEPREGESKPGVAPGPMFAASDDPQWGFIAHELQETLIESAATGYKDAPDHVQSPNPWTVIAALTKALQEAMARIEALEAAAAVPVR